MPPSACADRSRVRGEPARGCAVAAVLVLALVSPACVEPMPPVDGGPPDAGALDDAHAASDAPDACTTVLGVGRAPTRVDCAVECSPGLGCDALSGACLCPLGRAGTACASCAEGFVPSAIGCALASDVRAAEWPNAASRANGDAWLAVHHAEIRVLRPRVLPLLFVNPAEPVAVDALLGRIVAAFREGSRARGFEDAAAAPQLEPVLLPTRDLRDGVAGRPAAPPGWAFDNSTLYPRRAPGEPGSWGLDYDALFDPAFAPLLGLEDPSVPGTFLPLCDALDQGLLHELWIVGSGDVAGDASAAEVLAAVPVRDASGNVVPGLVDRCAGNGCFDTDVRACGRSLRVGFVNYARGPGCYVHSVGHGIESLGRRRVIPSLSEWLLPFARLDLDRRYGLPFDSLYGVPCDATGCVGYPTASSLRVRTSGTVVEPYDPACGNVHFPPNARRHYDDANDAEVRSSCDTFGRSVACGDDGLSPVSRASWAAYESLAPDCGGAFLVWWLQHAPGFESGHRFEDGRPMPSLWPFLYY